MLANGAALTSTLIAAISHSVTVYIVSALALGVYLALQSGTVDAMVYDTVLEATGDSDGFERHLGRLRVTSSAALTISALVGGALAAATSPRATYLMTAPFVALSILALLRFDEPVTHRSEAPMSLRQHVSATYRTILQGGPLLPVIAAMVLSGALLQAILEFGPLWLIDLHAPTALYGPVTAGCTASLGLGAVLAARLDFRRPAVLAATIAVAGLTSAVLVAGYSVMAVALALVALTTFLVAASTHLSRLLHDALPSSLRTGVGSGVSTLSWAVFVPGALLMGVITHRHGAHTAGWLIVGGTVSFGALFAWTVRRQVRREGCATQRPTQTPAVVSLPGSPDRRLTAA
jgi:MFS family permease